MKLLTNIRAKVWSCVSIALVAYLLATIATSICNVRTTESLTRLEEINFPLALKGEKAFTLFNEQTKSFETCLLTGEADELAKAKLHHEEISALLNGLAQTASGHDLGTYPQLLALRDSYEDYFNLAAEQYMQAYRTPDPFEHTQQMLRIGKIRGRLTASFERISTQLTETVIDEIKDNKVRTANNSKLLIILFVVVLIVITMAINMLANRQLIIPLQKIKEMIDNVARGKVIEKPQICHEGDEICSLGLSFWNMTEELKKISVSKDYLDSIISYMSDSLIVLSPALVITRTNQSALNLLSYKEEDLLNLPVQNIFSEYGAAATFQTIFEELLQGKSITNLEMMLRTSDNQHIPILFSGATFYNTSGRMEGIICLARDIRELKEELKNREALSNYDPLTHLPNRNLLQDRLSHTIRGAKRSSMTIAVLLLDLDLFSAVISTKGHETGNLILQETARRLQMSVRETDTVARMKRDQFAIILTSLSSQKDAELVSGKILKEISKPFQTFGAEPISISIGISFFPAEDGGEGDSNTLLKSAEIALYEAKKHGGNRFILFTRELLAPRI
ncbi:MAG: diguanylate cyclase [Deltaproteobacteria bacterium]|nr:diguanylate cyclase [Deltaproteobacteria bacterium]